MKEAMQFKNDNSTEKFRERIAEMGVALAKEYDLADALAKAITWYLCDQNIPSRQAVDEALDLWQEARRG